LFKSLLFVIVFHSYVYFLLSTVASNLLLWELSITATNVVLSVELPGDFKLHLVDVSISEDVGQGGILLLGGQQGFLSPQLLQSPQFFLLPSQLFLSSELLLPSKFFLPPELLLPSKLFLSSQLF